MSNTLHLLMGVIAGLCLGKVIGEESAKNIIRDFLKMAARKGMSAREALKELDGEEKGDVD